MKENFKVILDNENNILICHVCGLKKQLFGCLSMIQKIKELQAFEKIHKKCVEQS